MNVEVNLRAWRHTCERCGHTWTTQNELPGNCRGCNSPYWNKVRTR